MLLSDEAVLAAIGRALPHEITQGIIHPCSRGAGGPWTGEC
jgi:hypothetical protein